MPLFGYVYTRGWIVYHTEINYCTNFQIGYIPRVQLDNNDAMNNLSYITLVEEVPMNNVDLRYAVG